jgi:tetratricopeptide (TPR) repeat protein
LARASCSAIPIAAQQVRAMPQLQDPTYARRVAPLLALATQHLKAGQPGDAIGPLHEAALLQPTNATVWHDLGLACLEVGQVTDSVAAFRQSVSGNPRYTDAWFRLGIALEKMGDLRGAVLAYDRATELLPSHTEAWFRAGALVFMLGHREEAIGCFRRAAATGPKTSFGRLGKARALLTEDRDAEAEKVLRQAVALDPSNAMAHDLLGNLLAEFGRFAEAEACFARAIELAPLLSGSYYDLVRCRPVTDRALLLEMEAALETPGLEVAQRHSVHLALGKAADDLGEYALAMKHLDAADGVRRASAPFDTDAFGKEVGRVIERTTPELMARAVELGSGDPTPVLIVAMPRSGTTLVEQIVSSHPDVAAAGEQNFWNERGAVWHQAGVEGDSSAFVGEAAADYLALLREIGPKARRVTDKMPFNFLWAGLIHLALPRATIIHCRREAIDTALSIHQTHFHPGLAFPTGGPELVAYFRAYRRLTDHWRKVLPPDRFVEVGYEELTGAPEPAIRRIISACGLDWHDACLTPERNPRVVKTPSKWQTRQPIYGTSVARWRRYEPFLGPLAELLDDRSMPPE